MIIAIYCPKSLPALYDNAMIFLHVKGGKMPDEDFRLDGNQIGDSSAESVKGTIFYRKSVV